MFSMARYAAQADGKPKTCPLQLEPEVHKNAVRFFKTFTSTATNGARPGGNFSAWGSDHFCFRLFFSFLLLGPWWSISHAWKSSPKFLAYPSTRGIQVSARKSQDFVTVYPILGTVPFNVMYIPSLYFFFFSFLSKSSFYAIYYIMDPYFPTFLLPFVHSVPVFPYVFF